MRNSAIVTWKKQSGGCLWIYRLIKEELAMGIPGTTSAEVLEWMSLHVHIPLAYMGESNHLFKHILVCRLILPSFPFGLKLLFELLNVQIPWAIIQNQSAVLQKRALVIWSLLLCS